MIKLSSLRESETCCKKTVEPLSLKNYYDVELSKIYTTHMLNLNFNKRQKNNCCLADRTQKTENDIVRDVDLLNITFSVFSSLLNRKELSLAS